VGDQAFDVQRLVLVLRGLELRLQLSLLLRSCQRRVGLALRRAEQGLLPAFFYHLRLQVEASLTEDNAVLRERNNNG